MSEAVSAKVWIIAREDNVGTVVGSEVASPCTLPLIGASSGSIRR